MDSLKTLAEFRGDSIRQLSCTIRFFVDDVKETNKQTKVFCRFNLEAVEQREPLGWGRLILAQGDMGLSQVGQELQHSEGQTQDTQEKLFLYGNSRGTRHNSFNAGYSPLIKIISWERVPGEISSVVRILKQCYLVGTISDREESTKRH